ncbi:MAG: helix-turn-helix transcriptional regulator [Coriobacteriales bacterium]|nr:helix-turn-helix transcriptional regulator [Coriobacteriales bacterium]
MDITATKNDIRCGVGMRIRELRESQNLSQYKFATMVDVDRTYLIAIEKGRRNVSLDVLIKIAIGLDVHIADLFSSVDVEIQSR